MQNVRLHLGDLGISVGTWMAKRGRPVDCGYWGRWDHSQDYRVAGGPLRRSGHAGPADPRELDEGAVTNAATCTPYRNGLTRAFQGIVAGRKPLRLKIYDKVAEANEDRDYPTWVSIWRGAPCAAGPPHLASRV